MLAHSDWLLELGIASAIHLRAFAHEKLLSLTGITELKIIIFVLVFCTHVSFSVFIRNLPKTLKGLCHDLRMCRIFCLLCCFSELSAILDLGNQADFWQETSVYSTVLSEFLLVYLSIFFVQFYCGYRREIMR